ncbi:Glycosyltransferase involved in cell wall bisynthesis [Butyrivibrio proteoclasticus]|uniref:Glycosyltransferase involved in cell wall bisynthesis n=1 Tax=Butyrivibrio proteoclasticus TaxID=43305 RepID=A0A1I5Y5Z7_9FIRM|nr:glycosyltransferase family 2 protein [Butyrivibrio proteoclasticus]SFQ39652.1 Glycosyltransferase involved in cell wall bisynthesis [Butyrivibrio proteoclasticus]
MDKVSVIIPCYNVEKYIDRTLESIFWQEIDMNFLEVICVDDASTDNTFEKLKAWEKKFSDQLGVIRLSSNGRQGMARNIGLDYSTGKYIAFIDADDWLEKDYIKILHDIAIRGDYDVVQCEFIRDSSENLEFVNSGSLSEEKTNEEEMIIRDNEDRKKVFHSKIINNYAHCKLIKKELLVNNKIYFTEGLAYEDSYWGVLLNMYVKKACITKKKLYHYYVNTNSTGLSKNEMYHLDLLTNQVLLWNELKKRRFMELFKDEIEVEYVYSCVLIFWKMLSLRYDAPPYSYYRMLCAVVQEHIPDIMKNPYIEKGELSEEYMLILQSCLNEMNKADFQVFAKSVKLIMSK